MSKLDSMLKHSLDTNIRIIYSDKDAHGDTIPETTLRDINYDIRIQMMDLFGGATQTFGEGLYRCENGDIHEEHSVITESYTDRRTYKENADTILAIVERVKAVLRCESIALAVNNSMVFV